MNKASTTATNYLNSYMRQGVRGGLILEGKNFNSVAIRHRLNLLAVTPENESLHALKQLTVAFFFFPSSTVAAPHGRLNVVLRDPSMANDAWCFLNAADDYNASTFLKLSKLCKVIPEWDLTMDLVASGLKQARGRRVVAQIRKYPLWHYSEESSMPMSLQTSTITFLFLSPALCILTFASTPDDVGFNADHKVAKIQRLCQNSLAEKTGGLRLPQFCKWRIQS